MQIILSPAKQMVQDRDTLVPSGMPVFLNKTSEILSWLRSLTYEEAKKLWNCSDKIARENYSRLFDMNLNDKLTPAILAYDGIAFKYMAPNVFEYGQFDYVQEHLSIISGFYGVLKPMDGVTPYRLEMKAKAKIAGVKDLYEFWGDLLYREITSKSHTIINLASKEYSRCIERYLQSDDKYINCIFGEIQGGRLIQKGVYAKMARGEMVRYMAENSIESPEEIKKFNRLGYQYDSRRSDETTYIFISEKEKRRESHVGNRNESTGV